MQATNEHNRHDSLADKTAKKPNPKVAKVVSTTESHSMAYFTIRNIELETSIQEKDWSLFILKELQDNAFDWLNDNYPAKNPEDKNIRKIGVRVWLTHGEEWQGVDDDRFIHIAVRNSNVNNILAFENLSKIFDFYAWYSTKRNQHRMTTGSLGDALKRGLGMGYASWTSDYNPDESFGDKQWNEPLIIRTNGLEFKIFIKVDTLKIPPGWAEIQQEDKLTTDIGNDTEVEVTLPILNSLDDDEYWIDRLVRYYKIYKIGKSKTDFSLLLNEEAISTS